MDPLAANQGRIFLRLFAELRPHLHVDRNLPVRLQQRLARERSFGSRDRRLYRELAYTAFRHLPWFESALAASDEAAIRTVAWLAADIPATRPLKQSLPPDWPSAPPGSVAEKAARLGTTKSLLPEWFRSHCPAAFESPTVDVLHTRAPLWLRLQTDAPATVFDEFARLGWTWRPSAVLAQAAECLSEADVTVTDAFKRGLVEVQDLGSQLILAAVAPSPGTHWLDACAGAGGKTLQLARLLGPQGQVDATDPRPGALAELRMRAERSGLANVHTLATTPAAESLYDGVLVDAPCSGSGTWRRSPHLKWCTREADITKAASLQRELLDRFSKHVRRGGTLVYATCSLSRLENEEVVADFLQTHPQFFPQPLSHYFGFTPSPSSHALSISPALHNTDAFFVCALRSS